MSGPYDKEDAAEDTDSSISEVSRAWHDARDDAADDRYEETRDWNDRNNQDDE